MSTNFLISYFLSKLFLLQVIYISHITGSLYCYEALHGIHPLFNFPHIKINIFNFCEQGFPEVFSYARNVYVTSQVVWYCYKAVQGIYPLFNFLMHIKINFKNFVVSNEFLIFSLIHVIYISYTTDSWWHCYEALQGVPSIIKFSHIKIKVFQFLLIQSRNSLDYFR